MSLPVNFDSLSPIEQIAALRADNAALQAKADAQPKRKMSVKIGEKGTINVYGTGRYPISQYRSQWLAFIEGNALELVKTAIEANKDFLDSVEKNKGHQAEAGSTEG